MILKRFIMLLLSFIMIFFIFTIPVFAEADLESETDQSDFSKYLGIIIPYRAFDYSNHIYLGNDEIKNLPIKWNNNLRWGLVYSSKEKVEYSLIYSKNSELIQGIDCNSSNIMVNIGFNKNIYEIGSIRCCVFIRTTLFSWLEITNTSSSGNLTEANFRGGWLNRDWSINQDHFNTDDDDSFDEWLYIFDLIIDILKNSSYGLSLEYQMNPKISLDSRVYYSLLTCKSTNKDVLDTDYDSKIRLKYEGLCSEFVMRIKF